MKKYLSLLIIIIGSSATQAQDFTDALRYSQTNQLGTARFRALSGAMGALGGDLSAISINPASSSIFNNNQISVTLNNSNNKNNSNYFGTKNSESSNAFDLNQVGGVFVFEKSGEKNQWNKFALSINYENQNNFDNSLYFSGINPTNSIDKYFLYYANRDGGVSAFNLDNYYYDELTYEEQQAWLGYQSYIIDTDPSYNESNNRLYTSLVPSGGNYYQEKSIQTTGYNGKLTFNASAQYAEWLSIGLSLNSHFSDFKRSSYFFESNENNTTTIDKIKRVYFNNDLHTTGNGFSFQLGAIFKVTNILRLGAAYESPTWYEFTDELTQNAKGVSGSTNGELYPDTADPNITIVYDPYNLKTPGKVTLSGALVFAKIGLLSLDYSFKDYGNTKFKPIRDYDGLNKALRDNLDNTRELRIGAEHKIHQWSLRAGYRFEESPYKGKKIMDDLKGYSAGIGYDFGRTKLDFAYSTAKRNYGEQLFLAGLNDRAAINNRMDNFIATISFKL
ncbi:MULTISPECIES: OmpP1/FadL family transporter [Flavobacterium]|uniref:Outer membrane protein transport protein n=1 Tax=Flavobacterium hankyongi TaxID=1176532 RepID=A0ABP9A859_9FLAO|nr:outer membrane protein transport protein [Flavobacterium sp. N1846]